LPDEIVVTVTRLFTRSKNTLWRVKEARKAAEARNAQRRSEGKAVTRIPPKYGQVRANREKALFSHIWN